MSQQTEAHGRPVALLRPPAVRKLVELLRPLPTRERATILAEAVLEETMTLAEADQVLFALAVHDKARSCCSAMPWSRYRTMSDVPAMPSSAR